MNYSFKIIIPYLLFILMTLLSVKSTWSQVSPEERQALIDFYNATDGDNWANTLAGNNPWLIDDANSLVSDWFGVTVIGGGVYSLDLGANNLNGQIPASIGDLNNLVGLKLFANNLSGPIPSELGNLSRLLTIRLEVNKLTGNIPLELGNLSNVSSLYLHRNLLTGSIPSEIGNLSRLTQFYVFSNQMSGNIPSTLGNLSELTHLRLSANQFTGDIPTVLGNLSKLKHLELSANQLSGKIPSEFGNLNELQRLNLANNQLTGKVPSSLENLSNLKDFFLNSNNFVFLDFEEEFDEYKSNIEQFPYIPQAKVDQPGIRNVIVGEEVRLTSTALTSTNNSYQWYKDGVTISGATSKEYVISEAATADAGVYHFTATNSVVGGLRLVRNPITLTIDEDTCGVSASEKQALIDLYNATDGPNWVNNTNWLTDAPVCDWYGVTVDGKEVKDVQLAGNNLVGSIPSEIEKLTNLTLLELSRNKLTGTIPTSVGNITGLVHLYINTNELSGNIPESFGDLKEMKYLHLANNNLSGSIPDNIGDMTSLSVLALNRNKISGVIPRGIGNLVNLTGLYLHGNRLSGPLPSELGNLLNLKILYLHGNQLSGQIPSEIGSLSSLNTLFLYSNDFSGDIPKELGQLTNLGDLRLTSNALTGNIPKEFTSLPSLQNLFIGNNKLSGKIPDFSNSTLTKFEIFANNFVFSNFESEFPVYESNLGSAFKYNPQAKVDEVESLSVTENETITLTSAALTSTNNSYQWYKDGVAISGATSKEYVISEAATADAGVYHFTATNSVVGGLRLVRNPITLTIDEDTCGVSASEKQALIDLYNATDGPNWVNNTNWLTDAPVCDWYGVTVEDGKVTKIYLLANGLLGTLPNSIEDLINLEYLNVYRNQLSGAIPISLGNLIKLETLSLGENQLSGVIPTSIGNLTNLTDLNLFQNLLEGSIPNEIGNLINLKTLGLARNHLTGAIPVSIVNLSKITSLDISSNRLSDPIPTELGTMINLTTLNLYRNRITGSIPVALSNLTNLTNLALGENQLSGGIPIELGNLTNLTDLNLFQNLFTGSIPNELGDLINLKILLLGRNKLSGSIPVVLGNLTQLSILGLDSNSLTGEIPEELSNLNELTVLYLFRNQLTGAIPHGLGSLPKLSNFNIGSNALSGSIPSGLGSLAVNDVLNTMSFARNNFVFNDFESEFEMYRTNLISFNYTLQGKVDQSETVSVTENGTITLTSTALTSTNNLYQWYKNGVAISGAISKEHVISNATATDAGVYHFTAINSIVDGLTLERNPITVTIAPCSVSDAERDALLALYTASNGANWTNTLANNQPWDINIPVCDWYGVTVTNEQVTGLDLENNNLVGTLPDTMINLQYLTNIDVGNNNLTGVITASLGSLLELTSLSLDSNNFIGNIPPSLGSLSNLITLELGNNSLIGSIPIAICNLRNLRVLDLSFNQLSEELVNQLGLLTQLRRLDISHNEFEGAVPVRISNLRNLEYLAINDNKLSGAIPVFVRDTSALEEFHFENNQFIFSDFEIKHPDYFSYINRSYTYISQAKTDTEETKNVTEGNSITLSTVLSSTNNSYQWYKDGQPVTGATSSELLIENVSLSDAGVYYFTATNSVITGLTLERHLITLEVKETCKVNDQERAALIAIYNTTGGDNWTNTIANDQVWNINDPASLVCDWHGVRVEGDKVIEINLSNNNLIGALPDVFGDLPNIRTLNADHNNLEGILPSSLTTVVGLTALTIDHNKYLFSGIATGFSTHQSKLGTGFSYVPQSDVESLDTKVTAVGESFTLSATVFSNATNVYQWYKDGVLIDGATSLSYTIPSAASSDAGEYYLEATNPNITGLVIKRREIKVEINETGDTCLVSELEKQALIEFYTSTGGPNWTNNTNWLTEEPICNWRGITVIEGKVTKIILDINNLVGVIPSALVNLSSLQELRLSENNLSGVIPETIGNLTGLKVIFLQGNNLSGSIPKSMGDLINLSQLVLNNNKLLGEIPKELGNLKKMSSMLIRSNRLTGSIPKELAQITNLWELFLDTNQLTGTLPVEFGQLKNLNHLGLYRNKLTGPIPEEYGNLTNLRSLTLWGNRLTGSLPEGLGNLYRLKNFQVNNNSFEGKIPDGFANFKDLKSFNLDKNNFVFLDFETEFYEYKSKIRRFNYSPQAKVDQPETRNVLTGEEVRLTTSLTSQNNKYQWYKDNVAIQGATNKDFIIGSVDQSDAGRYFVRATNDIITNLTLERHPITISVIQSENCEVSDEERLALIDFYLSTGGANWNNTIEGIQVWEIDDLTSSVCDWYGITISDDARVIGIQLPNNNVRGELPDVLLELKHLKTLDISKNSLVGAIPGWLGNISTLETVILRENVLTGAIPSEIGDLSKLKILDLGINRLCCKIPDSIGNLMSMEYLDVSFNKLEGGLPNSLWTINPLHTIKLQNNNLAGSISNTISSLQRLQIFWVSNNQFSGVFPQTVSELSVLYSIRLDHNSFRGDLAQLIQDISLPNTDIQIQDNRFVFSDFEIEHPLYRDHINNYSYDPQARVDRTEYIDVELGGTATLYTEALTSPNNTYRWYREDGTFVRETTLREFTLTNIQDADLGGYYFLSTNSTIERLTLERNRIYLQLSGTNPDNPGIATQSFCISQENTLTVADLNSPIAGITNVLWYEEETGGQLLLSDDELEDISKTYWAESTANDIRVPLRVIINPGAPGIPEEDYQQFTIVQQPTIADIQITGENIVWYSESIGGTAYIPTDILENEKVYFAQSGNGSCRFAVYIDIGVFNAEGSEWQSFCASQNPTIADIVVSKTDPENTLVWYQEETGTATYNGTEPLDNYKVYYLVQRDNLGNETEERKAIVVEIIDIPPPQITNRNQVIYSNDPVIISALFAIGENIIWYDAAYEGTAYSSNQELVSGETYYGAQSTLDCDKASDNCCISTSRVPVVVTILPEELPTLIGCELFKPQPGAKYIINGWVREDGVLPINPQTQSFNTSEVGDLFVDLLNHLKDKITSVDPLERNLPPVYVPDPESRKYDALVPFIKQFTDDAKNFTIYNFKPLKEEVNGIDKTIGFSFKLDSSSSAPWFTYQTPNVQYIISIPVIGNTIVELGYSYPLLNQSSLDLEFTKASILNGNLQVESFFSIEGGDYYMNETVVDNFNTSVFVGSYDKYEYIADPDYEVMQYANSLLKLKYRNSEGNEILMNREDVEFRPQGPIIDGWQQVVADFRIPKEAANMIISLESRLTDGAAANTNVHFDDIRMHPFDSNMKTFVYDPVTQRLKAELDENNFATYYEYDQEGGLIRVKKETERGVYTIQETRSGNSKLNNSGR